MRVTRSRLEFLLAAITVQLGLPVKAWVGEGRNIRACVGALRLDDNPVYGGWDLTEIVNESGGVHSLIGNTFAGRGRLKSHEMESFLLGMLCGIERGRK